MKHQFQTVDTSNCNPPKYHWSKVPLGVECIEEWFSFSLNKNPVERQKRAVSEQLIYPMVSSVRIAR
jgi:hypothetical protein